MTHEKIFTRQDGTKIKIIVSMGVDTHKDEVNWRVSVSTCAPKKRTWVNAVDENSYAYRGIPFASKEREDYKMGLNLKHCTTNEIHEVKYELWKSIEPKL